MVDHILMTSLQAWHVRPLMDAMRVVSTLGYGVVDIGIPLLVGVVGWWKGADGFRAQGVRGASVVAAAGLLDQVVKNVSCRARPSALDAGAFFAIFPCFPASYAVASFPSGHATTAFAAAVVLALWFPWGAAPFMGLAVLVACSRVMLGAHFPSDVLAGAILGSLVVLAAYFYAWDGRWERDLRAMRKWEEELG